MLLAIPASNKQVSLRGLHGPAEVKALQQALQNLATKTGNPAINPGAIDGVVGSQTVQAVIAAQAIYSKELPTWAFVTLQAALAAGAMTDQAKTAVATAAGPLTVAINTAAAKIAPGQPMQTGFFSGAWYTTPMGIGLILVGAFVAYKLFIETPTPKKAA